MSAESEKIDLYKANVVVKEFVDSLLAMDGRATTSSLASLTLIGVAAAQDAATDPIQLLGFTFQAKNSLYLLFPVIGVVGFFWSLLYLGWKVQRDFYRLRWERDLAPMIKQLEVEAKNDAKELAYLASRNCESIKAAKEMPMLLFGDVRRNLEEIFSSSSGDEKGVERRVNSFFATLKRRGEAARLKYPNLRWGDWHKLVDEWWSLAAECAKTLDVSNHEDFGRFKEQLKQINDRYQLAIDPIFDNDVKDLIRRFERRQKDENAYLDGWNRMVRRGRICHGLVLVVPTCLMVLSLILVPYFRWQEFISFFLTGV